MKEQYIKTNKFLEKKKYLKKKKKKNYVNFFF